jgi:hypothetical protein
MQRQVNRHWEQRYASESQCLTTLFYHLYPNPFGEVSNPIQAASETRHGA